ncbi:MAG: hypothetical protein ABFD86_05870 [Bryobacteraceae bacterium]
MRLSARARPVFSYHWLREVTLGVIEADLGLKVASGIEASLDLCVDGRFRALVSRGDDGWLRLRMFKSRDTQLNLGARLSARVSGTTNLPEQCPLLLAAIVGVQQATLSALGSSDKLQAARRLVGAIISHAGKTVEKICAADLVWHFGEASSETALIDCSFDSTPEGLRLYRRAHDGDFTGIVDEKNEHVRLAAAVLTHGLRREPVIELHLPFVGRKEWTSRLEALAGVAVEAGDDGRIMVYSAQAASKLTRGSAYQSTLAIASALRVGKTHSDSSFKLSYTDRQTLARASAAIRLAPVSEAYGFDDRVNRWLSESAPREAATVESSLTLAVPGELVETWLATPGERDPDFFPVYSRMSVAVQSAMRRAIPFGYFRDFDEYETPLSALPLLVYQASRPFPGRPRSEFTYDVMEDRSMVSFYYSAARGLPPLLSSVSAMLAAEGRRRTAAFYAPRNAANILCTVQRNPHLIRALLAADAFYVRALIRLGLEGRRLSASLRDDTKKGARDLSYFAAGFVQSYHRRLRHLYAGRSFPALGAMILVEATTALTGATGARTPVSAVLRLKAGGCEQTFVNAAYRG